MLGIAEVCTAQGEPPPRPPWKVRVAAVSRSQEWEAGKWGRGGGLHLKMPLAAVNGPLSSGIVGIPRQEKHESSLIPAMLTLILTRVPWAEI